MASRISRASSSRRRLSCTDRPDFIWLSSRCLSAPRSRTRRARIEARSAGVTDFSRFNDGIGRTGICRSNLGFLPGKLPDGEAGRHGQTKPSCVGWILDPYSIIKRIGHSTPAYFRRRNSISVRPTLTIHPRTTMTNIAFSSLMRGIFSWPRGGVVEDPPCSGPDTSSSPRHPRRGSSRNYPQRRV